jgi:hypothetical protein
MNEANNTQVGGQHYASEYQHWDLIWRLKMGYFPGQITKYALRFRKKNGLQDLEKAAHFARKYSEVIGEEFQGCSGLLSSRVERELEHFFAANVVDDRVRRVFRLLGYPHDAASLKLVGTTLSELAAQLASEATPAYVNQAPGEVAPPP